MAAGDRASRVTAAVARGVRSEVMPPSHHRRGGIPPHQGGRLSHPRHAYTSVRPRYMSGELETGAYPNVSALVDANRASGGRGVASTASLTPSRSSSSGVVEDDPERRPLPGAHRR